MTTSEEGRKVSERMLVERASRSGHRDGGVGVADEAAPPDLLAGLRNGAWLHAQRFPPLTYAVPGVIPEGSTLLVGPPKIGKSWLVLGLGLAAAAGGRALSRLAVDARPVLYLALEDGDRRLQDRCRVLLGEDPIPAALEYLTSIQPGRLLDTIAEWLTRHTHAAPLVILDTLGKVMPPALLGESAYQRDYRIGGALKRLAAEHPGACVLVNHHDRKAGADDFVDSVSGTHGLAGAADTVIVLSRRRHETSGLLKVTGRDIAEGEYAVTLSCGGVWTLDGADLASAAAAAEQAHVNAGLSDRSAEIFAFVNQRPEGVGAAEVALALGLDRDTVGRYLRRLVESGRLAKVSRGSYTPVRRVRLSVTEGTDPQANGQTDTTDTPTGDADAALDLLTNELGAELQEDE